MSATTISAVKTLPQPDPVTAPYWESVRRHEMRLQRCLACRRFVFYPRPLCPFCFHDQLEWVPVSGRGVVYAFTIVHRAPGPEFQAAVPYTVALVDLEEGARMMTTIVSRPPDDPAADAAAATPITIGTAVEVVYDDVSPEATLPRFRPLPQNHRHGEDRRPPGEGAKGPHLGVGGVRIDKGVGSPAHDSGAADGP